MTTLRKIKGLTNKLVLYNSFKSISWATKNENLLKVQNMSITILVCKKKGKTLFKNNSVRFRLSSSVPTTISSN
jgi:hypothetical protein